MHSANLAARLPDDLRLALLVALGLHEDATHPRPDSPDEPGDGWYVRRFSALVRLDGRAPEATETRTVVATQDGVGERVVDDGQPSGELLSPDAAGEIHQNFPEPRQGFAYGVQWNG